MVGIFIADVLVTGAAAWLLSCASGHGKQGALEAILAWFWSFVALVAGAGVILGMTGGFGEMGFLVFHAAALVGIAGGRGQRLPNDWTAWRALGLQVRYFFSTPGSERLIGAALAVALAALTVIAACAQPAVVDALTYHLPRIGAWLQDERIHMLATPDARLNFVADLPDIVWAWLVGGVGEGFRLAVLAQAIGGIMAVGATVGLARQSGLSRNASMLAGALLLGMANVVVQFTAAQTDLFATGIFAVSFFLWLAALRRGECSWLGALGAGLALGAKGTLFYMAPTALLWVAWLAWHHRVSGAVWRRTLLAGALGVGLFALPAFLRNWQAYGGFLGPAPWVKKHHQGFDSVSGQLHKLKWNLTSSLAQNLEPHSQPEPLRQVSLRIATALVRRLPDKDPYTLDALDRKGTLEKILQRTEPDADAVSFGGVTLLLFSLGTVVGLVRWRLASARLILLLSAGVVTFVLFFHVMQQWHPYSFRYLVLMSPWVAVVVAWGIEQLGLQWRRAVWFLAALATVDEGWHVTTHTHQAGWKTVVSPERSVGYFFSESWREWSQQLDHPEAPFFLALSGEKPIGAFFRQSPRREVVFRPDPPQETATAEELLHGEAGWLIVPAARLLGREGRVVANVWLFDGDENHVFSLAAYRRLADGEKNQPIVYRQHRTITAGSLSYSFLIKTVSGTVTRFALSNPGQHAWGYAWSTPLKHERGVLSAGARTVIEMPMPADAVGEIEVVFDPADPPDPAAAAPTVEYLR